MNYILARQEGEGLTFPLREKEEFPNTSFPKDRALAFLPDGYVFIKDSYPKLEWWETVISKEPLISTIQVEVDDTQYFPDEGVEVKDEEGNVIDVEYVSIPPIPGTKIVDKLVGEMIYHTATKSIEVVASVIKRRITDKRWEEETGGITLSDGTQVKTGIDDQNRVSNAALQAVQAGLSQVNFKKDDGEWVTITTEQLQGVATAIALHVQRCFSMEYQCHKDIDLLVEQDDIQSIIEYDIEEAWLREE